MERTHVEKMPLYRDHAEQEPKIVARRISGYELSNLVAHLTFEKINARGQIRQDKGKRAVLRALCDRYPMVYPGEKDIAAKTGYSVAQVRRILRELEHVDKLIVDVNSRISWRKPTVKEIADGHPAHKLVRECNDAGKKGGRGIGCTPQYHICDRKIYDACQQQKNYERGQKKRGKETRSSEAGDDSETRSREDERDAETRSSQNETHSSENQSRSCESETRSCENSSPLISELNPLTVSAEPISRNLSVGTYKIEPTKEPTTSSNQRKRHEEEGGVNGLSNLSDRDDLLKLMAETYAAKTNKLLNPAGKDKLLEILTLRNKETVMDVWNHWINHRDLEGMNCPLIHFIDEFQTTLDKMVDETKYADTVHAVWNYYLGKMRKNSRILTLTPVRKEKGIARLRDALGKVGGDLDRAEHLMKIAVDALAGSEFHNGINESEKHFDSWERNLFGNQEQFECWLDQS